MDAKIADIREQVGNGRVICGLSGGVDSAVAAVLIHEAIGDQLTCVFVDHGLMRMGEAEQVVSLFRNSYNIPLVHVDASADFLGGLVGVSDPEAKRKFIGAEFITSSKGVGYQIAFAYNNFDNNTMYALIALVLTIVIAVNMMLHAWERRLLARRQR